MKKVRSELVKERQPPKHAAKNPRCKRVPRQVIYFTRRPFCDFYLCNEDGFAGLLKSGFGGTGSGLCSGHVVPQEHPGRKKRAPDRSDTRA